VSPGRSREAQRRPLRRSTGQRGGRPGLDSVEARARRRRRMPQSAEAAGRTSISRIRSRRRASSKRAGCVVATKSWSRWTKRRGSSRCGKWPAPGNTSSRLPGMRSWAAWAWRTGISGRARPKPGAWADPRPSRAWLVAFTRWPRTSSTLRAVSRKARRVSASPSDTNPRHTSSRSGPARRPRRSSYCMAHPIVPRTRSEQSNGSTIPAPGLAAERRSGWTPTQVRCSTRG